jgi:hypothetical protein
MSHDRCPGQGNQRIVGHDGLISSCSEDGGGVDLHKFDGVNRLIVLLWQVGSDLAWPDHHLEIWCEHHTPPEPAGELGGWIACTAGAFHGGAQW